MPEWQEIGCLLKKKKVEMRDAIESLYWLEMA